MDRPSVVGASFLHQVIHSGTDVFTKQGLSLPFINVVSPEISKFLMGSDVRVDLYTVSRAIVLSLLIDKVIEMCHRLYFDPNHDNKRLYDARTMKILMYSNTMSSVINLGYVGITRDMRRFDFGGIMKTLYMLFHNQKKINEIKDEFIRNSNFAGA